MQFIYPIKIYSAWNIGQPFGANWVDYSQFGFKGHNGFDFPAERGEPIYAVHDGWIIEQAAKDTGFGLRISQRIRADGKHYLVVYGHMLRLENPVDVPWNWTDLSRPVKQGQIIGYVDSTGYSTGDHLHLGLYEYDLFGNKLNNNNGYGGAIDPYPYIGAEESMLEIVLDNGTYWIVGNKAKLGIHGEDALAFWRRLTDKERVGSTAGIPSVGTWERLGFGVDPD